MHPDWLIVVNLGSFAMVGIGLVFVVLWAIDRTRTHALSFAASIGAFFAGTTVLSIAADPRLTSSIHGVLLPLSFLLLVDGLLRRVGRPVPRRLAACFVLVLAVVVWYFAYVHPLLVGRIVTQNLGLGALLALVVLALCPTGVRLVDRAPVIAAGVLAVSLLANPLLALMSDVPREITSDADMERYLATPLEVGIILSSAVLLPALMVTLLAVTFADIVTDLRTQRDRDQLTGLLNRRGFLERAERELERTHTSSLILADLDYFKEVNDALGHAGGDFALETFADVIRTSVDQPQIVGRIGGEEFAVLLPDVSADHAHTLAERVRSGFAATSITYGGSTASVTASFGVAAATPSMTLRELLDAADHALYDAKARGRNRTAVVE